MNQCRAMTKDGKEVKGCLFKTDDRSFIIGQFFLHENIPAKEIWLEGLIEVIPESVGQDTGLMDKNGTPIFGSLEGTRGGDRVTTKDGGIFVVVFDSGAFRLQDISTELWFCVCDKYEIHNLAIAVIGKAFEEKK